MKADELREMDAEQLEERARELGEGMFRLRFRHAVGSLDNTAQLKSARRERARVLTVIKEKKLQAKG